MREQRGNFMGDVPTWVGSITTTLALVAAGWAVVIELRRDRAAQRDRQVEQARLIAGWTDPADDYWVTPRNGSSLPVYDVQVDILSTSESWEDLFGMTKRKHGQYTNHLDVLPPGDSHISEVKAAGRKPVVAPAPKPDRIQIEFTDAKGSRWKRDNEHLTQLLYDRTWMVVDE
jgi:hypothetical protein